jgi:two-component system, OmpR family, sensor histidine kinase KdpD
MMTTNLTGSSWETISSDPSLEPHPAVRGDFCFIRNPVIIARGGGNPLARETSSQPDPDRLLRQVDSQERELSNERLKVFLGYASGVGKSFRMLDEGRRRRQRGQDVVIGALQPDMPQDLKLLVGSMETILPLEIGGGEAMNVEAILARRPEVCLVDGAAYDNPPGSRTAKRWQDIMELVHSGIVVVTSLNIQHIEERQEEVERITGKRAAETVPESFLYSATEIVIVDVPPELLLERTGGPDSTDESLAEAERRLSALRELALLLTAEVVDKQLEDYLLAHGIEQRWGTQERILVCLSSAANAEAMVASGKRNAQRFHGEMFVAFVRHPGLGEKEERLLQERLDWARRAGAHVEVLDGDDPVEAVMDFARARGITQIFVAQRAGKHWWTRVVGGPIDRLIRVAEGIDVRVFPH